MFSLVLLVWRSVMALVLSFGTAYDVEIVL
jgi:hypothetical protein